MIWSIIKRNIEKWLSVVSDILIISDGKPGHVNQSKGLAEALVRRNPALAVEVRPPLSVFNALSLLIKSMFFGGASPSMKPTALVLAAGHKTHWTALALGRFFKAKTVVLMKPSLPISWFDQCVIPEHDLLDVDQLPANVIQTRGALNRVVVQPKQHGTGLILLGGPSKHYEWHDQQVLDQISSVLTGFPDTQWTLATSRRTPDSLVKALSGLDSVFTLVLAEDTSSDWLPNTIAITETCWVTEDSISMTYEALTAGCVVNLINLLPAEKSRVVKGIERLKTDELVGSLSKPASSQNPIALAEADRSAEIILGYGWLGEQ